MAAPERGESDDTRGRVGDWTPWLMLRRRGRGTRSRGCEWRGLRVVSRGRGEMVSWMGGGEGCGGWDGGGDGIGGFL